MIVAALLLAACAWRISAEEKLLTNAFGQEYIQYCERTKSLVPFLF